VWLWPLVIKDHEKEEKKKKNVATFNTHAQTPLGKAGDKAVQPNSSCKTPERKKKKNGETFQPVMRPGKKGGKGEGEKTRGPFAWRGAGKKKKKKDRVRGLVAEPGSKKRRTRDPPFGRAGVISSAPGIQEGEERGLPVLKRRRTTQRYSANSVLRKGGKKKEAPERSPTFNEADRPKKKKGGGGETSEPKRGSRRCLPSLRFTKKRRNCLLTAIGFREKRQRLLST